MRRKPPNQPRKPGEEPKIQNKDNGVDSNLHENAGASADDHGSGFFGRDREEGIIIIAPADIPRWSGR